MTKFAMLASAAILGASLAGATAASAQGAYTVIGTEDEVNGFSGPLFPGFPTSSPVTASPHFDPYGAGYDTSDGPQLLRRRVPSGSQAAGGLLGRL